MAEGKLQRDPTTGKIKRSLTNGKLVRNSSDSTACCCDAEPCDYYRARRCCDDTYVDFALSAAELPQLPFTFTYNDPSGYECWYVNSGSQCVPSTAYPIISVEDVTEYDDCDDCRVTCTDCTSEDDCSCCSLCDALTPTDFTLVLSGINAPSTCYNCPDVRTCTNSAENYQSIKLAASWSGGTFTLTQTSSCTWEGTGTGPTLNHYSGTGCVVENLVESSSAMTLFLQCTVGGWSLSAIVGGDLCSSADDSASLFNASLPPESIDCCGRNIIENDQTVMSGCTATDIVGTGGIATLTPC
jgi:hypothetical protein